MLKIDIETLQRRAVILNELRRFFCDHQYWEVETPLLSHDTCVDRWLNPFELQVNGQRCFLQTSPEFAMKRLLCQGAASIFQICKAFRQGEAGENHNPEFTMVEWYRAESTLDDQIEFVSKLIKELISFVRLQNGFGEDREIPFQRMTYESAFKQYVGLSALKSSANELFNCASRYGWHENPESSQNRDDLLNYLIANAVEPQLTQLGVVILTDYPASQAALAKIRKNSMKVADRFELYFNGIEICNGYQELTDPVEMHERMVEENSKRRKSGERELPTNSFLLEEMHRASLPESAGVALGFDRLVMILLGKDQLRDVIPFPFEQA